MTLIGGSLAIAKDLVNLDRAESDAERESEKSGNDESGSNGS